MFGACIVAKWKELLQEIDEMETHLKTLDLGNDDDESDDSDDSSEDDRSGLALNPDAPSDLLDADDFMGNDSEEAHDDLDYESDS